jgi:hypothetical protein
MAGRMSLWQKWKQTTIANKLVVATASIVAFTSAFQLYLWKINADENSKQTDRLIAAYEKLAEYTNSMVSASRQANQEIVSRADRISRSNEDLSNTAVQQAEALKSQAESSKQLSNFAEQSARSARESLISSRQNAHVVSRAYVSINSVSVIEHLRHSKHAGKIHYLMEIENNGNSPAKVDSFITGRYTSSMGLSIGGCPRTTDGEIGYKAARGSFANKFDIQPKKALNVEYEFEFSSDMLNNDPIPPDEKIFALCGSVRYETLGVAYIIPVCWYSGSDKVSPPESVAMTPCPPSILDGI